jgi:hypothetical protein
LLISRRTACSNRPRPDVECGRSHQGTVASSWRQLTTTSRGCTSATGGSSSSPRRTHSC